MKTATKNCSSLFVKFAKWKLATVFLFLIANCLLPTISLAQPGSLDTSFGIGGIVTTNVGIVGTDADPTQNGYSMAIQNDEKIVVAGYRHNGSTYQVDFVLVRYNHDGSLDNTFDKDGIVTTDFGNGNDFAYSVAIQSDDKILVAGFSNNVYPSISYNFALARYNSDGSLDNTFGNNGKVTTDFGNNDDDFGRAMVIQSDGKIVVVGFNYYGGDVEIARYKVDGSLDDTFGSGGKVTTDFNNENDYALSVALQSDGKILVAGSTDYHCGTIFCRYYDFALVRYNINGSLDNSFGADGKVVTDVGGYFDRGSSVFIQNDGKILVAGSNDSTDYASFYEDFAIVRYNDNGTLDNTFGSGGKVLTDFLNKKDEAYSMATHRDGKILVAGGSYNEDGFISSDFSLARYNSNGSLDNSFDSDGKVTTAVSSSFDGAHSIIIQKDGKIVVGGISYNGSDDYFTLVRYNGGTLGIEDSSFASNTIKVYPNPATDKITLQFTTQYPENAVIKIADMMGKIVFSRPYHIENDNLEMDVTGLTTGIYLLNIESPEFSHTEKIVVAK